VGDDKPVTKLVCVKLAGVICEKTVLLPMNIIKSKKTKPWFLFDKAIIFFKLKFVNN
jgi:hypothetical protein